jgi:hypothetical protein
VLFEPNSDELLGVNANKTDALNFRYLKDEQQDISVDYIKLRYYLSSIVQNLIDELWKVILERAQANKKRAEYHELSKNHQKALAAQASSHIKMVQELMEMIPVYEREKAMDNIVRTRAENVVEGKFR